MSPRGTLAIEQVWKRFRTDRPRGLLRDELQRLRTRWMGRPEEDWRWALRGVDLRATPGDSIGLIGLNGSGKSTLLKMVSRVMLPYAGRVDVSGRVAALIEVRAGLHPDLTGRENIFLYGSLLGLPRREVARRFDDIVDFAALGHAVDRQLKFYSNGMQVRLGFAVVAFLEPDVLLIDEALAVGDAVFQQRCLDRMRYVLRQGTTLVYVSHDLATVAAVCSRAIWLHDGMVECDGPVADVLASYGECTDATASRRPDERTVRLLTAEVVGDDDGSIVSNECAVLRFVLDSAEPCAATVYVGVSDGSPRPILLFDRSVPLRAGGTELRCIVPRVPLPRGRFNVWMAVVDGHGAEVLEWHRTSSFEVQGPGLSGAPPRVKRVAPIQVPARWEVG